MSQDDMTDDFRWATGQARGEVHILFNHTINGFTLKPNAARELARKLESLAEQCEDSESARNVTID